MAFLPIPDLTVGSIYELTAQRLTELGIKLLLLDLDNTLATYSSMEPSAALRQWISSLQSQEIEPFIFSNAHGSRVIDFAVALGIDCIETARKPGTSRLKELLQSKGVSPEDTAIIGDQIYTDILCGVNGGIMTIAVKPISLRHPLRYLRYIAELPFRLPAGGRH